MPSPVPSPQPHVVIFPFMAQGHTLPLLDLSKALSCRNIKVSIVTTPSNAKSMIPYLANFPAIHRIEISFPQNTGLPEGCENTSQLPSMDLHLAFLNATKQLKKPFEDVLESMSASKALPLCVISDFFLGWTLQSCQALGVPRLVFHGMGVLSMAISKSLCQHTPHLKSTSSNPHQSLDLPGIKLPFDLTMSDVPDSLRDLDPNNPFIPLLSEIVEADVNSWGVIINSFVELERSHIPSLESFYNHGAKAWCVGPLFLYDDEKKFESRDKPRQNNQEHFDAIQWLTEQVTPASAVYVSFGTQAGVTNAQLDEIAYGLIESGCPFAWVVRSTTWSLPNELEESMKSGKGLIIRDWIDQREMLTHRSVGGFMSHCGWNSTLESISAGVPILAWPMMAEQTLNAKLVVEGLGAGIGLDWIEAWSRKECVSRGEICRGVRELMRGENGKIARERAQALGRVARCAVKEGGSSHGSLDKLLTQLHGFAPAGASLES